MGIGMVTTWIVVGLLTGGLAKVIISEGGHGLVSDLLLGVGGSGAACLARGRSPPPRRWACSRWPASD